MNFEGQSYAFLSDFLSFNLSEDQCFRKGKGFFLNVKMIWYRGNTNGDFYYFIEKNVWLKSDRIFNIEKRRVWFFWLLWAKAGEQSKGHS